MKKLSILFLVLSTVLVSCSSDDDTLALVPVKSEKISNLEAIQTGGQGTGNPIGGVFTKFDFETGKTTTSDTDWDVAFRGTTIAINGGTVTGAAEEPTRNGSVGAAIVTGTFAGVTSTKDVIFTQDADAAFAIPTVSDKGWYNYAGPPTHLISPIPGKILIFKTRNGNYVKVEILSYYQDEDTSKKSQYYTFNYVYNPNKGETSL
ncbi:heme-binding HmuY-like protein [Aquimarina sp. MAR_2010_214]|uniref:HmuY family protein n=1 Tax=Aquimarina sp. MAR_2010_214 TaxID=1250026 RepID=UPI000C702210|nr:HmuY family protein [Aquimarina sp. MAR_2010_214]PKV48246.1 heme-binding HmuY-like protein [Aquimarina sp. MAR_2010_214]